MCVALRVQRPDISHAVPTMLIIKDLVLSVNRYYQHTVHMFVESNSPGGYYDTYYI